MEVLNVIKARQAIRKGGINAPVINLFEEIIPDSDSARTLWQSVMSASQTDVRHVLVSLHRALQLTFALSSHCHTRYAGYILSQQMSLRYLSGLIKGMSMDADVNKQATEVAKTVLLTWDNTRHGFAVRRDLTFHEASMLLSSDTLLSRLLCIPPLAPLGNSGGRSDVAFQTGEAELISSIREKSLRIDELERQNKREKEARAEMETKNKELTAAIQTMMVELNIRRSVFETDALKKLAETTTKAIKQANVPNDGLGMPIGSWSTKANPDDETGAGSGDGVELDAPPTTTLLQPETPEEESPHKTPSPRSREEDEEEFKKLFDINPKE